MCDFSFACHNDSTTKCEYVYGTNEFMSPEVAMADDFDMSADMFSFGILLCELITGLEPSTEFLHRRAPQYFALNTNELSDAVLPECPTDLHELTLACCDVEPSNRPTSLICYTELMVTIISHELIFLLFFNDLNSVYSPVTSPVKSIPFVKYFVK